MHSGLGIGEFKYLFYHRRYINPTPMNFQHVLMIPVSLLRERKDPSQTGRLKYGATPDILPF